MMLLLLVFSASAQQKTLRKNSFIGYPVGFHLPETRFGIGAVGAYHFYINKKDTLSPASSAYLGFAATQNKQLLFSLPFHLYWNERKHSLSGELSYNDYFYNFYGIGGKNTEGIHEKYKVDFALFRINYLRKVKKNLFIGARWWYEDYRVGDFEKSLWLTSGAFLGGRGSVTSGPGIVMLYDSRDNIFFSSKGNYLELVVHQQAKQWGSEFSYNRYRFDARNFLSLAEKWSLANMLFGDFVVGDVPFSQLASIGSDKRMRGFYPGRYRDNLLLLYQGEMRGYFYKRWGASLFWNYALLADNPQHLSFYNDRASIGTGLRFAFDKEKKTNIRLDTALPLGSGFYRNHKSGNPFIFYLAINEAF